MKLIGYLTAAQAESADELVHVEAHAKLAGFDDLTRTSLSDLARVALRVRREIDADAFIGPLREYIPDKPCTLPTCSTRWPAFRFD